MALAPTLPVSDLTNAQCRTALNEILAFAGIPAGMKVRGLYRRVKLGRDVLAIRKAQADEQAAYGVMQTNETAAAAALATQQAAQRAIADQARADQAALVGVDYGTD